MKKLLMTVIMLVLVSTTVLTACGGNNGGNQQGNNTSNSNSSTSNSNSTPDPSSPTDTDKKAEPFTVSLRHIQIGEAQKFRKAILDDVVAKTEAEVPGLTFELEGVEDSVNRFTKLPAEMAAGNPPKIFDLFGGEGDALKYGAAGRLLDLAPILEELGLSNSFLNLDQFTLDGKVYGLPIGGNIEGFYYNEEIFATLGLPEPKTWAELEQAAQTLTDNGYTAFAMGSKGAWVPLMLVNTLIGRYAGPESISGFSSGEAKWNSPEVVAAYAKYEEWVKKGYFTKGELGFEYADMLNEFLTGKAGMMFDGSWRSSVFSDETQAGALTNKVGFFTMPAVEGGVGDQTYVNGNYSNGYGFSSDLNEQELVAVKAFIKNMYSEEMQLRGLLEDGVLPSIKLSSDALSKVEDKIVKKVITIMGEAGGAFSHFDSTVQSSVYKETEDTILKLIAGQETAQSVADQLQAVQDKANQE
ncbi:ABC transporter substrate-binding protein [Paenibacillus montaniterrae]|uniref:ABC transporter substrate-binding protein n=1 Tax=Paenibacillus montaniterrae TaxID=429341 RepID=A0A920CXK9_9BACL|nr:extracellular solute-binding protein [Paenibacillus montaniterrae]GIP16430.1 ABC transporter substrate-binding protein [Paenibacillus montaniterrae]